MFMEGDDLMDEHRMNYLMQCALGMCEPEDLTPEEGAYLVKLVMDIIKTKEKLGEDADKVTFTVPVSYD